MLQLHQQILEQSRRKVTWKGTALLLILALFVYLLIIVNKSERCCPKWPWSCCCCCWRELQSHLPKGVVCVWKPELVQTLQPSFLITFPVMLLLLSGIRVCFTRRETSFATCLINSRGKKSSCRIFIRSFCWLWENLLPTSFSRQWFSNLGISP